MLKELSAKKKSHTEKSGVSMVGFYSGLIIKTLNESRLQMNNKISRIALVLGIIIFCAAVNDAQTLIKSEVSFVGNLREDSKNLTQIEKANVITSMYKEGKKPFLAGVLSLILPGAGEFYSESYIKSGIFLALEAAAITTAIIYDNKGDDQTSIYKNFADGNWDVSKYAAWLWNNREALGIPNTHGISSINEVIINNDPALPTWERVDFSKLNLLESKFSHRLPKHGDQQYYEMIGKYPQFNHGWIDQLNDNTPQYNEILTPMFNNYSTMRGKANDFYNVASKAVVVIYVNHFLSALDAVWSAVSYNKDFSVKFRVSEQYFADKIEIIPKLNISYNF
ncbi:MAG: hypothetical protein AB9882_03020 [Ignavibacteriaceae bacterium]